MKYSTYFNTPGEWDALVAYHRKYLPNKARPLVYEACGQDPKMGPHEFSFGPHTAKFWRTNTMKYVALNEVLHSTDGYALLACGVPIDLLAHDVSEDVKNWLPWWQLSEYPPGYHVCSMKNGVLITKPMDPTSKQSPLELQYHCLCGLALYLAF